MRVILAILSCCLVAGGTPQSPWVVPVNRPGVIPLALPAEIRQNFTRAEIVLERVQHHCPVSCVRIFLSSGPVLDIYQDVGRIDTECFMPDVYGGRVKNWIFDKSIDITSELKEATKHSSNHLVITIFAECDLSPVVGNPPALTVQNVKLVIQ